MANITIVKLKVRRGSDAQRKQITLDQGEVGYTLDTRRLFVGDGSTLGGRVIGNTSIGPFSDITNLGPANSPGLQVGDIGYSNNKLYRLTSFNYDDALSGFAYIGNVPDESTIEFGTGDDENKLIVKKSPGALNAAHFDANFFGDGLLSAGGQLQPALNSDYLFLSTNDGTDTNIAPKVGSITQREIYREALGPGLSGGNLTTNPNSLGEKIKVDINTDQFEFEPSDSPGGGRIKLKSIGFGTTIPISSWAGGFGDPVKVAGMTVLPDDTVETDVQGVAGAGLSIVSNNITLDGNLTRTSPNADGSGRGSELGYPEVTNGLVTDVVTSIYDVVTGLGLSGQNVGDSIPIGAILPHSRAFTNSIPAGYLLCNGWTVAKASYQQLFDVIESSYGDGDGSGNTFSLPNLTGGGMPGFLYGADALGPQSTSVWVSGGTSETLNTVVSGLGVNYIIKYMEDPLRGIFNGSPDQVSEGLVGAQDNQVYECLDSAGDNVQLSSGGFIRFALSGISRSGGTYNRFAIPVFNY